MEDEEMQSLSSDEFLLKETNAHLQGWKFNGDNLKVNYDHVKEMQHVCVRVVKARDLRENDVTGSCDPYVEVRLGNYKKTTHHMEKNSNPEWNKVFNFSKDQIQDSILEVIVKDKDVANDDFIGRVVFDLNEIPYMVSKDGPLAPQWYSLEDKKNEKAKGELMLAVWMGTVADDVSYFDASESNICSSVYLSPKLWYLKVTVIEAQDLQPSDESRFPDVFVKAMLGNHTLRTTVSMNKITNPMWNEDLIFVAAEPFDVPLILSVEDRIAPNKSKVLGRCTICLQHVDRRLDHKPVNGRWYNLERHVLVEDEKKNEVTFASKVHMRICLEGGGYHVPYESTYYSSDLRPTERQLWNSRIGVLELGILDARGLPPMKTKDGQETTDAYCVAKYEQKWVRTRTITDSFDPIWNEQYAWEVFDPCTVLTVGVFDNFHWQVGEKSGRDSRIGKIRICLAVLETERIYSYSYPLLDLQPSGLKKMGEIHLAIRFTCSSLINMVHMYSQPLLPKMHYIQPLAASQLDKLRHQATQIVSIRLSRAEPPLRKEVVEYMLEVEKRAASDTWSLRKSKLNLFRIMAILSVFIDAWRWFDYIRNWKNPMITVVIHMLFLILVMFRQLILPAIFLCLFLFVAWYYEWKPERPLHIDIRLSQADSVHPDELDEEFDMFPSLCPEDVVRMRYDRGRSIAWKMQAVLGDLATQGERLQYLLCWRDPRATVVFAIFCLVAAIILYVTPFEVVAILTGFYVLRHPRFRNKVDSVLALNFFTRLPHKNDCLF